MEPFPFPGRLFALLATFTLLAPTLVAADAPATGEAPREHRFEAPLVPVDVTAEDLFDEYDRFAPTLRPEFTDALIPSFRVFVGNSRSTVAPYVPYNGGSAVVEIVGYALNTRGLVLDVLITTLTSGSVKVGVGIGPINAGLVIRGLGTTVFTATFDNYGLTQFATGASFPCSGGGSVGLDKPVTHPSVTKLVASLGTRFDTYDSLYVEGNVRSPSSTARNLFEFDMNACSGTILDGQLSSGIGDLYLDVGKITGSITNPRDFRVEVRDNSGSTCSLIYVQAQTAISGYLSGRTGGGCGPEKDVSISGNGLLKAKVLVKNSGSPGKELGVKLQNTGSRLSVRIKDAAIKFDATMDIRLRSDGKLHFDNRPLATDSYLRAGACESAFYGKLKQCHLW